MTALLLALLLQVAGQGSSAARQADPVQMGVSVRPDTVTVGDHFEVRVRIRAPLGATIAFPAGPDSGASVEATDPRVVTRGPDSSVTELTAIYRLAAWDTGLVRLALGDARVSGPAERVVPLGALSVRVRSVLPADTAKHVPKPPRDIFGAARPWWHWLLLALLAALVIGLLIWWLWRKLRRRDESAAEDPFEVAEREFARIEGMGLLEAGERGRFVALVVEAMRAYLAARLPEAAPSLTSTELLRALRTRREVPVQRLAGLLYEADLVKFARRPIGAEAARELGAGARSIVRETQTALETPAAPEPAKAA